MRRIRYDYLKDITRIVQPKRIIEIGVAEGSNAMTMLNACDTVDLYIGYDVFQTQNSEFHQKVGNSKSVATKEKISERLLAIRPDLHIILHEGMTQDTLWTKGDWADLVWLDGDHRIDAIRRDYESVKDSKVIVFDDYYTSEFNGKFSRKEFGCYEIFKDNDKVLISPPTSRWPDIRIVVVTEDEKIRNSIRELFSV